MISGNDLPPEEPDAPFVSPAEAPLRVAVHLADKERCQVTVAGEIDFGTHRELLDTLVDLVERGHHRVVLDLSETSFCDSTGLGVFVQIRQRATAAGGWLRVAAPTEPVRRALEITNLDRLIPVYESVTEATTDA